MSEGSRWLLSVALYALAALLAAPAAYGTLGLYFLVWGVPWPSQDWTLGQFVATYMFGCVSFLPFIKAREMNR